MDCKQTEDTLENEEKINLNTKPQEETKPPRTPEGPGNYKKLLSKEAIKQGNAGLMELHRKLGNFTPVTMDMEARLKWIDEMYLIFVNFLDDSFNVYINIVMKIDELHREGVWEDILHFEQEYNQKSTPLDFQHLMYFKFIDENFADKCESELKSLKMTGTLLEYTTRF